MNKTGKLATIFSELVLKLTSVSHGVLVLGSYEVVSAVPLPAALPLFGFGLVGLAAAKRRRKATV